MKYLLSALLLLTVIACKDDKPKKPTRPVVTQPPVVINPPMPPQDPVDPPKPDPEPPVDPVDPPKPEPKVYVTVLCDYYGYPKYYKDILELKNANKKRMHILNDRYLFSGRFPSIKCKSIPKTEKPEVKEVPKKRYTIRCGAYYYSDQKEMAKEHCNVQAFTYKNKSYRACRGMPSPLPPVGSCVDIRPETY